ncbi:sulfatase [Shivajiella indica]|uniref:Sulfatase n=1 Tax=Shivajiella indica TaxID=872115 RepID=A0ABW5B740_9BACT
MTILMFLMFFSTTAFQQVESLKSDQPNILFLIADDWSYPHAGIYGDKVVLTPTFDKLAKEGALFLNAYTASPSCSPSRASILNGRYPHQNEQGANLWPEWPAQFPTYVSLLEDAGYFTGSARKGWGPGEFQVSGLEHNPAGKTYADFESFYKAKAKDQPFTFWFGSSDPHRDYEPNTGIQTGMKLSDVIVPDIFPDLDCIRNDILDYYFEVERFDRECGQIIRFLEEMGELNNTIVVMTSDNGMPFPRAKANLYDLGTRMPLAIRWPNKIKAGTVIQSFVNFVDFSPSFLEAAGLQGKEMSGKSLWPILEGKSEGDHEVFLERERHANVRKGDLSYPSRAIRTHDYLYIRNLMPERYPAGDPTVHQSVGQYGDVDNSITKFLIMALEGQERDNSPDYFELSFGLRPEEELYVLKEDPYQINNVADLPEFKEIKSALRKRLDDWMLETGDRRATEPRSNYWDQVRYTPTYQMKDVDFMENIINYWIRPPFQSGEGIPCEIGIRN